MLKRLLDIVISLFGLLAFSPVLLPVMFLVWWQDHHSPFYVASRVGVGNTLFKMVKLRSMIANADKSGVNSTSGNDRRITPVGAFIRKYKLDEITQLWNVLIGDMSLVGPRPNVKPEVDMYTVEEQKLIGVKPGITDISSIVFSDEGDILKPYSNPDLAYNQVIRPWKSRLGILYVENQNLGLDLRLIFLTAVAIVSKESALKSVNKILHSLKADPQLIAVSTRKEPLYAFPPPGATEVVQTV